jgi:AcrR family transcriptional regulator
VAEPARVARTQGERSAAMQKRLLDATVASLIEKGYAATTTLEVQQRAGVSRGALLHHYGSRQHLMVAAVEHLSRGRVAEVLATTTTAPPEERRTEWAVGVLWKTFEGPLYAAALELWVAARHDPELLAALQPQERILGQAIRSMATDLFGPAARTSAAFGETLDLVIDAMRGAAARSVLRTDTHDEKLLASWTRLMKDALGS